MIQLGLVLQNRYRVVKLLGKGGFGETFEVDDRGTAKVLKVLNLDSFRNPELKEKAISLFQREADVLMRLNHPGIPRVEPDGYFTAQDGVSEPFHCLVMEKIDGYNLQEWLQQRGNQPLTQEQAIDWLKQLVAILAYLHTRYFHRDIKPENIIVKPDGKIVLIDFGGVREVTNTYLGKFAEEREITVLMSPKGYTPLEQIKGRAVPQSDFFALGRTFTYLLTGKHPDQLPEDDQTGELIWRDEACSVCEPLANLIDKLMALFPSERPQNTQVILQWLAEIELVSTGQLSILSPTELQITGSPKNRSLWLKPLTKTRKALIGLVGIAVIATVLNFPKFTVPKRGLVNISGYPDLFNAVAFSPNGQILASGSDNKSIKLWNPRTGKLLQTFSEASSEVWTIAISPDGQFLASGHWRDKKIKLWDLGTGKLLRSLPGHSGEVRSVAFSPNSQTLASGSQDKTIKLWRVSTGELLHTFSSPTNSFHTKTVTSVAFSPDGKTLASASDDKTIKLWHLDTMKFVRTLTGHSGEVLSVIFSPDGQTLVSGSGWDPVSRKVDNTIKLWNLQTGKLRDTLKGHDGWVWSLAISPNGQILASGSYDFSIKLWNLRTGKPLRTLAEHSNKVYSVAFSRDGQSLASGSHDKSIKIWPVSP